MKPVLHNSERGTRAGQSARSALTFASPPVRFECPKSGNSTRNSLSSRNATKPLKTKHRVYVYPERPGASFSHDSFDTTHPRLPRHGSLGLESPEMGYAVR